jgi:hypothetical protein
MYIRDISLGEGKKGQKGWTSPVEKILPRGGNSFTIVTDSGSAFFLTLAEKIALSVPPVSKKVSGTLSSLRDRLKRMFGLGGSVSD